VTQRSMNKRSISPCFHVELKYLGLVSVVKAATLEFGNAVEVNTPHVIDRRICWNSALPSIVTVKI
jgi:hypothetical protein